MSKGRSRGGVSKPGSLYLDLNFQGQGYNRRAMGLRDSACKYSAELDQQERENDFKLSKDLGARVKD